MTAREHLVFYCRVKGIPEETIPNYTNAIISHLGLTPFADQMSKGYSGGNKRKLSVGVALVGNPRIVFLVSPPVHILGCWYLIVASGSVCSCRMSHRLVWILRAVASCGI